MLAERTGIALAPPLGRAELSLVAAVIGIGLALATIPASLAYRQPVAFGLRGG